MKTWHYFVIFTLLAVALLISCGKDKSETAGDVAEMAMTDELLIQSAADSAIARFSSQLKAALQAAMKEGGPVNAIGVCNEMAPEIAAAHSVEGWYLERVTDKSRNANNQADSTQLDLLAQFAVADSAPAFIGRWVTSTTDTVYRYFKPIRVGELCLNCHGGQTQLAPGIAEKVAELYPEDMATGYQVGDLRGMFVVEIEWPQGKTHAERLVGGQ